MYHINKDINQKDLLKEYQLFRQKTGFSQVEIAKKVGFSRETLNKFENGKIKLRTKNANRLSFYISQTFQLYGEYFNEK